MNILFIPSVYVFGIFSVNDYMSFSRLLGCNDGVTQINIHREAEKKEPIFFCVRLFYYVTETGNFLHTLIGKYTSYNSVFFNFGIR